MRYPVLGDIFKEGRNYYFNFRPDCDLVRKDNPEIYLVKGKKKKEPSIDTATGERKKSLSSASAALDGIEY